MPFPLPKIPHADYHKPVRSGHHARWFGAPRDQGRRVHAGCDLIAARGTPIFAIDDGIVEEVSHAFYNGTGALAVRHHRGFVVRYCEVETESIKSVRKGQVVRAGDTIATVGKMLVDSMLHLELYAGTAAGRLSMPGSSSPFKRRSDLLDPTDLLDSLRNQVQVAGLEVRA